MNIFNKIGYWYLGRIITALLFISCLYYFMFYVLSMFLVC